MSNNPFGDDELDSAWGVGPSRISETDVVTEALRKEAVLKSVANVYSLRDPSFV